MDEKTIAMIKTLLRIAIKQIKKQKYLDQMFHLFDGNKRYVYLTRWKDTSEKRSFATFLHDECIKCHALYVIAISDIWISKLQLDANMSKSEVNKIIKEREKMPPSQDPNKEEALICAIVFPNGKTDAVIAPYIRGIDNLPIFKDNPQWFNSEEIDFNLIQSW